MRNVAGVGTNDVDGDARSWNWPGVSVRVVDVVEVELGDGDSRAASGGSFDLRVPVVECDVRGAGRTMIGVASSRALSSLASREGGVEGGVGVPNEYARPKSACWRRLNARGTLPPSVVRGRRSGAECGRGSCVVSRVMAAGAEVQAAEVGDGGSS